VAMLREKQVEMMESFKPRYLARFDGPLPKLMPTAVLMAVQPLQQDYHFEGYYAPIVQVQDFNNDPATVEMARPELYGLLDFTQTVSQDIAWEGEFVIERNGTVNALRFITKNVLAVLLESSSSIDWLNRYMAFPLATPVPVRQGDRLRVSFQYRAGGLITSLQDALRAEVV
ncbi:MAG: methyltransferase type 12, partial [Burkholderiaceae bacterium]|nr:methyltransferase type 12 [Burkholderiaceae bacterium]